MTHMHLPDPHEDPDTGYGDDVELLTGKPLSVDVTLVEKVIKTFNDVMRAAEQRPEDTDDDQYPRPEDFFGQDDEDDDGTPIG